MHNEADPEDCRILVVDDNIDAADSLVALLDVLGFKAYAVYGGEQALAAAETLHPRLVFLDIDMPGMSGLETATCMRQAEPADDHVELVALTARTSASDRAMSRSVGFDLHVGKPIAVAQLTELAAQACSRS